ncbi:hypothetical protein GCM10011586_03060 [Silvibacterium dinghuense]|nr:hypothetical protein GCM10011586_03060 [Silvibacterium dinghuense]
MAGDATAPIPEGPQLDISDSEGVDARRALVERIAVSQRFRSSIRLRDFLFYVADCALRDAPEEATEQQIGMRVFGRAAGYNSSEDSIVRTQARLLRMKLTDYFSDEGAGEELILEIPKGHYLPAFHLRNEAGKAPHPVEVAVVEPAAALPPAVTEAASDPERQRPARLPKWLPLVLALAALLVLGGAGWWGWSHTPVKRSSLERLWGPFFAEDSLVIYSNALFTGDSRSGLRYAPPGTQAGSDANLVDTYTGIGETAAVYDITRLFDAHHADFTLKRSLLVTWDEAKLRNLVFIGSVAENLSLRDITSTTDFTLMRGDDFAGIANHHPKPGEPAVYARPEHPLDKDYAILALLPGVQPGKKMLVFSGLTTMGTQAAVEFACHHETLDELVKAASGAHGELRPFEAVLETSIGGGVPLQTRLVTVHVH